MKWLILLLSCALGAANASYDPVHAELEEWVVKNGGEVGGTSGKVNQADQLQSGTFARCRSGLA
jgi:hypothetical protein